MAMFDRVSQYGVDPMSRGAANISALTVPRGSQEVHESFGSERDELDPDAHPATAGNPLTFLFILIGLIVAMFFVHKASPVLKTESFGVNWLSFAQVTVMAITGILLTKAFFGRFQVPGISNAVAAI